MDDLSEKRASGQTARNFLLLGGGQVLSTMLGILFTATLGRTLGPSNFGTYYLIMTTAGFFSVVVDWGQFSYVVREIARGRTDRGAFLGSAAFLRTVGVIVSAAAGFATGRIAGYSNEALWLIPAAVVASFPATFVQFLGYAFRGINRTEIDVISGLAAKAVGTIATILVLYLGGGLRAAVLVPAVGGLVGLIYSFDMLRKVGIQITSPVGATVREVFVAGAPLFLMALTISVHSFLDVTLLAILATAQVVGWLGAARTFIGVLMTPATILAMASFPEMCRAVDIPQDFKRVVSSSARVLLAAGSLAACLLFTFALPAVGLVYGHPRFDPSAVILEVCAPFFPIFFINFLMGNAAIAMKKSMQIASAKLVCVAISGVLSWFLIQHFQAVYNNGAIGLLISYGATELLMSAAYIAILPQGLVAKTVSGHLLRAYAVAGLAALAGGAVASMLPVWLTFGIVIAVFTIVAMSVGLVQLTDFESAIRMVQSFLDRIKLSKR